MHEAPSSDTAPSDRLRQLDRLEIRLMARREYHRAELTRLGSHWGGAYAWEEPEQALLDHLTSIPRVERMLGRVRERLEVRP